MPPEDPRDFGGKIVPVGVSTANDPGQTGKWLGLETELFQHRIEAAPLTPVAPEGAFNIEGCSLELLAETAST